MAPLIEAELAGLDRAPVRRVVARHPDAPTLADTGLAHPALILLLYSRDSAGPVGRIELGSPGMDGSDRCVRIQQNDALATVSDDVPRHLVRLLQLAGSPS